MKNTANVGDWLFFDTQRITTGVDQFVNPHCQVSHWNNGIVELDNSWFTVHSNGFRINTTDADANTGFEYYAGIAWADQPLKYANAM